MTKDAWLQCECSLKVFSSIEEECGESIYLTMEV